ncbi:amidohydrolase family protein [Sphingomonas sp.]|uniref:amidohydrolase family protein n=1 Tax=Sphingomonas sp. TaxID=28214 RepID=UPI002DD6B8A9|nr:amidohydrolase family protein [Sphingomonas sp.]
MKLAFALPALALLGAAPLPTADLVLRGVTVIDVAQGRALPGQAVVVKGDRIVAVGVDAATARGFRSARSVDARGRYVMPGLWDMHVHFGGGPALIEENKALMPLYIAHGITSVRDCAGDLAMEVLGWRDDIAAGRLFGPTLYTSGPKIEGLKPIWKGTIETGTRADIDAALDRLQGLRADFVKITDSTLTPELFLYAVRAAKARGLRTSGHIPMALTVGQAVDAGIGSIEHLDYAFKPGVPDEAAIAADFAAGRIDREAANARLDAGFAPATARAAYARLARTGVVVSPTLNISRIIANLDREDHSRDPYLAYIGPGLRKTYDWRVERAAKATPAQVAARHAHYDRMVTILPMLAKAGVPIMAGTDAGFLNSYDYPGIGLHDELALYVRHGLTPAQALRSTTITGPAWLGKGARYGAVVRGKAADLLLLDRNPLADIAATRGIHAVVLRGGLYDRAALDRMLAGVKARVAAFPTPES